MSEPTIGVREFQMAIEGLRDTMQQGFAGVHARQDKTNGRIDRLEGELSEAGHLLARHDQRLHQHDREIGDVKKRPAVQVSAQTVETPAAKSITVSIPMDTKTVIAVIGALAAVVLWVLGRGVAP